MSARFTIADAAITAVASVGAFVEEQPLQIESAEEQPQSVGLSVDPIPSQMFSGFDGSLSGRNYAVWGGCAVTALLACVLFMGVSVRPPPSATLVIVTKPVDATIVLNGRPIAGHSPFRLEALSPNTEQVVEVRKPGFISQVHHVELAPAQTKRLPNITLEPIANGTASARADSAPNQAALPR